jgi:hypothetical protein
MSEALKEIFQIGDAAERNAKLITYIRDKESSKGFEALTEQEQVVNCVATMDFELNMGFLPGLLFNVRPDQEQPVIDSLNAIGAERTAQCLSDAFAKVNQSGVSRSDYRKAVDWIQAVFPYNELKPYEQRVVDLEQEEILENLLASWIDQNKDKFLA